MTKQNLKVTQPEVSNSTPQEFITRILAQSIVTAVNKALTRILQFKSKQKHIYFPSDLLANEIFELESKITFTTDETNRESLKRCTDVMKFRNNNLCVGNEMWLNLLFKLNKITFEILTKIQEFNYCHLDFEHLCHTTSQIEQNIFQKVLILLRTVFGVRVAFENVV